MSIWKVLGIGAAVGVGIGALVLASGSAEAAASEDNGVLEDRTDRDGGETFDASGRDLIEELGRRGGLTDEQIRFLVFVARNESQFNTLAGRGDPDLQPPGLTYFADDTSESRAAKRAFDRNRHIFEDCGHDESAYYFGSGGLFAFLPVYPLYHFRKTPLRCAHPYEVFDPAFAIAAAYSFARGISQHPYFDGTVVELRAGWGGLGKMKDANAYAGKLTRWRKQLRQLGIDERWLFAKAPQFPKRDLVELYRSMGGTYGGVA